MFSPPEFGECRSFRRLTVKPAVHLCDCCPLLNVGALLIGEHGNRVLEANTVSAVNRPDFAICGSVAGILAPLPVFNEGVTNDPRHSAQLVNGQLQLCI